MSKQINNMFEVVCGSIVDETKWYNNKIDTIVNAANPTLMGSDKGVDGAIHKAIDDKVGQAGSFNKMICNELKTKQGNCIIRCKRGEAVTTSGGKLCKYVIHVVGAKYDGKFVEKINCDGTKVERRPSKIKTCTSSCVKTLESCYQEIIEEVKNRPDIKVLGVPIIGAGEYQVPFKIAAEIAVASVGNALVQWKNEDKEMFEMAKLEKIIFFVYGPDGENGKTTKAYEACINKFLNDAKTVFEKNRRIVCHTSWQSSMRYFQEIIQNDSKRGYFAIAKAIRFLLWIIRYLFLPLLLLKDLIGKKDWEKRRCFVEGLTFCKAILPVIFLIILRLWKLSTSVRIVLAVIIIYFMLDTVTYLLTLILMADIQNPSANLIRSIILLFVNYVEIAFDFTFLYYCYNVEKEIAIRQALVFGFLNDNTMNRVETLIDYGLVGLNTGVKFFFVTLVLGYFMGHFRQRKFRS